MFVRTQALTVIFESIKLFDGYCQGFSTSPPHQSELLDFFRVQGYGAAVFIP